MNHFLVNKKRKYFHRKAQAHISNRPTKMYRYFELYWFDINTKRVMNQSFLFFLICLLIFYCLVTEKKWSEMQVWKQKKTSSPKRKCYLNSAYMNAFFNWYFIHARLVYTFIILRHCCLSYAPISFHSMCVHFNNFPSKTFEFDKP